MDAELTDISPDSSSQGRGLAHLLLQQCSRRGWSLGVIESLTGGGLAAQIVSVPGASDVFRGGLVSYSDQVKISLAHVDPQLLALQTPYCAAVAQQMPWGAAELLEVDVCISTTGVAGPGPDRGIGAGTVYLGLAYPGVEGVPQRCATKLEITGSRNAVRSQSITAALEWALQVLTGQ